MTLGKKIGGAFAVVLVTMALSGILVYQKVGKMSGLGADMVETRLPTMLTDYQLAMDLELTQTRVRDVILANGD
jgi:hypothetical protein